MNPPDPAPVIEIMEAFRRSKAMFTAVAMGTFDVLADGPLPIADLATRMNADREAARRLLEACVGLQLLTFDPSTDLFANTPLAETYLRRSSAGSLAGYILYSDYAQYPMWAHLDDAVREGTPRWEQTFGRPGAIFDHFFSTPEKMRTFTMAMHGLGVSASPSVATAFDLSRFHTIADLGAATGHLVVAACEAWPNLRGVVFDLEKILPFAAEFVATSPARDRITLQAGDFFTSELPPADLYALGRVLHDWDPDKIRLLLDRILDRLPSGGGLLIAEKLLRDDRSGPLAAQLQSLNMLVCTEGRERSLAEYRSLLLEAGFATVDGGSTGKYLDAVLATKA